MSDAGRSPAVLLQKNSPEACQRAAWWTVGRDGQSAAEHVEVSKREGISPVPLTRYVWFPSQLCVVMIFLVTVVMCRGIISVMMYHTGSPVLRTEV